MLKKTTKTIALDLAIAFFFTSLFIVITNLLFHEKIDIYLSYIDKITIIKKENTQTEKIELDPIKKRLTDYPNYGEIWATMIIPDIELEEKVYHGDTLDLLKYGIGHYVGSYFPGEGGSVIFAAHNSEKYFKRLPELKVGSKIIVKATYGTYTYEVIEGKVMKATELEKYEVQSEKEEFIAYTCYPMEGFSYRTERYVIFGKLVGVENEK